MHVIHVNISLEIVRELCHSHLEAFLLDVEMLVDEDEA